MQQSIYCDIAIVGAGSGGLSVVATCAQLGLKVVIVEASKMGGDCLNSGCVPSKSLLAQAKSFWHLSPKLNFAIDAGDHFMQAMQHVHKVIDTIAVHDSVARFESLGAEVILEHGEFIDSKTLQAGNKIIKARRFVLATGSHAFIPPIPGLAKIKYWTNDNFFTLTELPKHLIVIGGGPIGVELAQAVRMFGAKVTVLEALKILPKDEHDCAQIVKQTMADQGIGLHEGIKIKSVCQTDKGIEVIVDDLGRQSIFTGTHILVATGRRANVAKLGLEKAGINYTERGIEVNARLRTSNKKVYAIGDVVGPYQFTHVANYHAGIVIRNILFKLPAKVDYAAVPWVTYTDPELAHVGLLSQDAAKSGLDYEVVSADFKDNDRAQADGQSLGKIKLLVSKKGIVLGVTIVGAHAGELILPWVMVVREKKSLRAITDCIVPYPTLSEVSKRAAANFYAPRLFSKFMQRLVKVILRLG